MGPCSKFADLPVNAAETTGLENMLRGSLKLSLLFGTTLPCSLGLVGSTTNFETFLIGTNCKQVGVCNYILLSKNYK